MTIVSTPRARPESVERTWGACTADHCYRADVIVQPLACAEPPIWMAFSFAGHGTLVVPEFLAGAQRAASQLGCEILTAALTQIDGDEYDRLATKANTAETVHASRPLTAADFAEDPAPDRRVWRRR